MKIRAAFALLPFVFVAACATEVSDETDATSEEAQDLSTSGVSTYFVARHDNRKCVSPLCGGYWVSRVNYATTKCADGKYAEACYVAELDLGAASLDDTTEEKALSAIGGDVAQVGVVFRGTVGKKTYGGFGQLGRFRATEAWLAPAPAAVTGVFYKMSDSGVRCVTAPCANIKERKLNSSAQPKLVSEIDLAAAPGTMMEKARATALLFEGVDLVVAGNHQPDRLVGESFFVRAKGKKNLAAGQVCDATAQCAAGLLCCYPCGIEGCQNKCIVPAKGGECPLFP